MYHPPPYINILMKEALDKQAIELWRHPCSK